MDATANCGVCGNACALAHASADCVASTCAVAACDAGWADCNANPAPEGRPPLGAPAAARATVPDGPALTTRGIPRPCKDGTVRRASFTERSALYVAKWLARTP